MENTGSHLWMEIDTQALQHNLLTLQKEAGRSNSEVMGVVKADAYGHGIEVVKLLFDWGLKRVGVATVEEGCNLRKIGFRGEILVLGGFFSEEIDSILDNDLVPVVSCFEEGRSLAEKVGHRGETVKFHLKIDTGMGRGGFLERDLPADWWRKVIQSPFLSLAGIMTHFSCAESDREYTESQFGQFLTFLSHLPQDGTLPPFLRHCSNSAAFLLFPEMRLDLSRLGIALFGVSPTGDARLVVDCSLRPVMAIKTRIKNIKTLPANFRVGYGSTFVTSRETKVAVVSLGYAQGLFRSLSNRLEVLVRGKRVPALGTISMDQMVIDVSGIEGVKRGEVVTVLGREGEEEIRVEELAHRCGTIPHEILCSFRRVTKKICR